MKRRYSGIGPIKYAWTFVGVHIVAKKLLKRFSSSQKSETNLPSTNTDGIAGMFSL